MVLSVSSRSGVSSPALLDFQLSLPRLARNEPEKRLPPDLVSMLTTPPWKRPYSADTPEVEVVVSWIESSM